MGADSSVCARRNDVRAAHCLRLNVQPRQRSRLASPPLLARGHPPPSIRAARDEGGNMKYRLTTTLKLLRDKGACPEGFRKLKRSLGPKWADTKPINLLRVLKSNGVQDMCWCFCATREDCDKVARLIAADFAQSVLHHFTAAHPNDDRPAKAIQAARDFVNGKITAAAGAAGDAAGAAGAASPAAAGAAAGDAARDAAWDAVWAAGAAAGAAAGDAARD